MDLKRLETVLGTVHLSDGATSSGRAPNQPEADEEDEDDAEVAGAVHGPIMRQPRDDATSRAVHGRPGGIFTLPGSMGGA